jgi:hypothetical protein
MKKKQYLRPSVEVFELNHQQYLLAGSDVSATMEGTFTEETLSREFDFGNDFDFGDEAVITSE